MKDLAIWGIVLILGLYAAIRITLPEMPKQEALGTSVLLYLFLCTALYFVLLVVKHG